MSSLLLIPWFFLLNFVLDVRDREAWVWLIGGSSAIYVVYVIELGITKSCSVNTFWCQHLLAVENLLTFD
ncbi:hypothetical protein C4D60_Mb04t34900 [Musa balbisiana]|uniref:Uncharacterized protein n=1 Tax=Musa balbisiana TaxID=52838 RepID=A0A4S8KH23_MUSBA|nr:hypothetical protein C4D60_Mb04t34900 [Musa balbisiana]